MIFLYIFLFEENYNKVSKQSQMKRTNKIGGLDSYDENKNICLTELKMDRVVYFAARRETGGGWQRENAQQHLLFQPVTPPPLLISTFSLLGSFTGVFRRISSANVRNAFSMFIFAFALVSKNLIPCSLAICSPLPLGTTLLSSISHLFPSNILSTSSLACSSMFLSHLLMFSKLLPLVMSYTSMIPIAPL